MISRTSLRQSADRNRSPVARFGEKLFALKWFNRLPISWKACFPIAFAILLLWNVAVVAQDAPPVEVDIVDITTINETAQGLTVAVDTLWVLVAGFLVFFMNAGFGMLEVGFCRQKNAVNILSKNLIVFALASTAYWIIGFSLMFSDGSPFIGGLGGMFLNGADNSPATGDDYVGIFSALNWTGIPLAAKFFFQLAFAGTAATIVSGTVAERIKFLDFLIFSFLYVGIAYPITGHWVWGGGWLYDFGFWDFAGSSVVHMMGGCGALMGAIFLGYRSGRYRDDGTVVAIPGHNMGFATLGCLILWLGWFGFNPGSTMGVGDGSAIAHIAVATNIGAAFGGIAATFTAWLYLGKPDLSMIINGILAGLVAVTAGCAFISFPGAAIIGAVGGVIVVFSVGFFDKLKIDDPVGALSVHLVNGAWGTLAIGLFSVGIGNPNFEGTAIFFDEGAAPLAGLFYGGGFSQLWIQLVGVVTIGLFTCLIAAVFWGILKATLGIRVTEAEEYEGLDIAEHGMEAYPGFIKERLSYTSVDQQETADKY